MINIFRKSALMLVIFIHTHIYLISYFKVDVPEILENCYNNFFGNFHPASILAAISGYLYFKTIHVSAINWPTFFKDKYIKRIYALWIPYFFWITFFFLFNNLLIYFTYRLNPSVFINKFHAITLGNYIQSFFFPEVAIAKHLWYLVNLLILFIAAPVLIFVNKSKVAIVILIGAICAYYYLTYYKNLNQVEIIIKYRFILFFVIGAFIGLNKKSLDFIVKWRFRLAAISLVVFALLNSPLYPNPDKALLLVVNNFVVNVFIFLVAYMIIGKYFNRKETLYKRSNHFLLYVIHPIILSVLCKLLLFTHVLMPSNYLIFFIACLALTFLVTKINDIIYFLINNYFPKFTTKFL